MQDKGPGRAGLAGELIEAIGNPARIALPARDCPRSTSAAFIVFAQRSQLMRMAGRFGCPCRQSAINRRIGSINFALAKPAPDQAADRLFVVEDLLDVDAVVTGFKIPAEIESEVVGTGSLTIRPIANGPNRCEGPLMILGSDGRRASATLTFLCRCGESQRKPYCDGTHKKPV